MLEKEWKKKKLSRKDFEKKRGAPWQSSRVCQIILGKRGLTIKNALDLEECFNILAEKRLKCQIERKKRQK